MNKSASETNLELRAQLFKALGHPARLLILNLLQTKARHGEELAAILNLKPATISHHLLKLSKAGLLDQRKDQYYQTYSLKSAVLEQRLSDLIRLPQVELQLDTAVDAYRDKVLKTFFRQGSLVSIPAQRKKRQIILEQLTQEFEPQRRYSEREVNLILVEFHEDVATLRREMVGYGLLTRERGVYWRNSDSEDA